MGPLLDSKGYGIAMRKGECAVNRVLVSPCAATASALTLSPVPDSEYRQALNLALLNLQEAGVLREMKNTWWNEKHGGGACKVRLSCQTASSNSVDPRLVTIHR